MTDARITQAAALALGAPDASLRITDSVLLALYGPSPPLNITQSAGLALLDYAADSRITEVAVLALYRSAECATSNVQCWKITRTDGEVFAFTTHDRDLTFMDVTYKRCDGVKASAIGSTANSGAATGDVQVSGILADAGISDRDLYSGRFDGAKVIVYEVDWKTGLGKKITGGIVSRTVQREGGFTMTVLTGGARLEQQPLLEVYSALCRWEFGSVECGVDVEALRISSSVTGVLQPNVVSNRNRRQFADSARVEAIEVYRNARLTWTSGANSGMLFEVKDIVAGVVTLWQPCPFDIALSDAYTIVPGCGKTKEDCITRFDNYVNFGGFPDLPGNDSINLTPNRTQ